MPAYSLVEKKLTAIEAEMRRIGLWQRAPLPEAAYTFQEAFAMDTMAFPQWLQFVFIPRVKSIVQARGEFPASSNVGTQAIREFDGYAAAAKLISLLGEFDELFDKSN
jgi:uncharacterized protein YqcC (DUF446 family)